MTGKMVKKRMKRDQEKTTTRWKQLQNVYCGQTSWIQEDFVIIIILFFYTAITVLHSWSQKALYLYLLIHKHLITFDIIILYHYYCIPEVNYL